MTWWSNKLKVFKQILGPWSIKMRWVQVKNFSNYYGQVNIVFSGKIFFKFYQSREILSELFISKFIIRSILLPVRLPMMNRDLFFYTFQNKYMISSTSKHNAVIIYVTENGSKLTFGGVIHPDLYCSRIQENRVILEKSRIESLH